MTAFLELKSAMRKAFSTGASYAIPAPLAGWPVGFAQHRFEHQK